MSKFFNVFFLVIAVNIFVSALSFYDWGFLMFLVFLIPIEFFVGLLFVFYKEHRETGLAFLAASGVSLLVAGFVCSSFSIPAR